MYLLYFDEKNQPRVEDMHSSDRRSAPKSDVS